MEPHERDFEKLLIRIKKDFFADIQMLEVITELLLLMFGLRYHLEVDRLKLQRLRSILKQILELLSPHIFFHVDHQTDFLLAALNFFEYGLRDVNVILVFEARDMEHELWS